MLADAYPKLLQQCEMRNILNSLDEVVGNIQCDQFDQGVQSLHLFDAIVTNVEFLEVDQCLQSLDLGQAIALNAQHPQPTELV